MSDSTPKPKKSAGQLKRERLAAKAAKESKEVDNKTLKVDSKMSKVQSKNKSVVALIKRDLALKKELEEKIRLEELARLEAERIAEEKRKKEVEDKETKRLEKIELRKKKLQDKKSQGKYVQPGRRKKQHLASLRIKAMIQGESEPCKKQQIKGVEGVEINSQNKLLDVSDINGDVSDINEDVSDINGDVSNINEKIPVKLPTLFCACLGHVDSGKTSLIDKIQGSSIQFREAGGITQKISATYIPVTLPKETHETKTTLPLVLIDLPGHELFYNLRSRGSELSDLVILVVDFTHGLQEQTIESIKLLNEKKMPFIIVINKIDRIYGWTLKTEDFKFSLDKQSDDVKGRFNDKYREISLSLAKQGLNCSMSNIYHDAKMLTSDEDAVIPIVPISAVTGEGIPELLSTLMAFSSFIDIDDKSIHIDGKTIHIDDKAIHSNNNKKSIDARILEVRTVEGLGNVADVLIRNGNLNVGDKVIIHVAKSLTAYEPVITTIKAIVVPELLAPLSKIHKTLIEEITSPVVQICADNLIDCLPGSRIHLFDSSINLKDFKCEAESLFTTVKKSTKGIYIQASSLGSLESLLVHLTKNDKIPISNFGIGTLQKKHITMASTMDHPYNVVLAFDVKISPEIHKFAEESNVEIYTSDVVYKLLDMINKHADDYHNNIKLINSKIAVFPVVLQILKDHVYNKKNPIIMGVKVIDGVLKLGAPLCVSTTISENKIIEIGNVTSIQQNHIDLKSAKKGDEVCIKIEYTPKSLEVNSATLSKSSNIYCGKQSDTYCGKESDIYYGRHFDHTNQLISLLTRESIDKLKESFKDEVSRDEWLLIIKLKPLFNL